MTITKTENSPLEKLFETGSTDGLHVCFVCTGNTCRSPMAAAVLNELGRPYRITAESAGIAAYEGDGMSIGAENALKEAGIQPRDGNRYDLHRSHQIDEAVMKRCDRVIAMSERHMMALTYAYPQYVSKIEVMPHEISDPFGGSDAVYERCLGEITDGIRELFKLDN